MRENFVKFWQKNKNAQPTTKSEGNISAASEQSIIFLGWLDSGLCMEFYMETFALWAKIADNFRSEILKQEQKYFWTFSFWILQTEKIVSCSETTTSVISKIRKLKILIPYSGDEDNFYKLWFGITTLSVLSFVKFKQSTTVSLSFSLSNQDYSTESHTCSLLTTTIKSLR